MTISFPKSSHHSGLRYMKRNPHPKKELVRDCGVRAIWLACDLAYKTVFDVATECKRTLAQCHDRWSVRQGDYISMRSDADASKGLNKDSALYALSKLGLDVVYKTTTNTDGEGGENYLYFYAGNLPDR